MFIKFHSNSEQHTDMNGHTVSIIEDHGDTFLVGAYTVDGRWTEWVATSDELIDEFAGGQS